MPRPVVIDGHTYPSVTKAAIALGVNRATLSSRLIAQQAGKVLNVAPSDTSLTILGQRFDNATQAALHYGINRPTFISRLRAGWQGHKLISTASHQHQGKSVLVHGKAFGKVKDMLAYFDIDQSGYNELLRMGLNQTDAVDVMQSRKPAIAAQTRKAA